MRIIECCNARWDSRKLNACPRCGKTLQEPKATPPAECPTPETDAATYVYNDAFAAHGKTVVRSDVARRLERERDEARELIAVKDRSIAAANQTILLNNELLRQATDKLADRCRQLEILCEAVQQVLQFKPNSMHECAYECAVWDNLQTTYNETKPQ